MKDIHEYITEAFIRKDNIKQAADVNMPVYYFVPTVGDKTDPFEFVQKFKTYNELLDVIYNNPDTRNNIFGKYKLNIDDIVDIHARMASQENRLRHYIPAEYKKEFKKYYLIHIVFPYNLHGNSSKNTSLCAGYVNCSDEIIKQMKNEND